MFPRTPARPRGLPPIGRFPKKSRSGTTTRVPGFLLGPQARGGPGPSDLLALTDPGHGRLGRPAWRLVLAITPVTARALFVLRGPAGSADHDAIMKLSGRPQDTSPSPRFAAQPQQPAPTPATGGPGAAPRASTTGNGEAAQQRAALTAANGRNAAPATYAALARRILRRRSEALSSSFRPPQVPYFSGRETA